MKGSTIRILVTVLFSFTDSSAEPSKGLPQVDVPDGKAVIYIYRAKKFAGGGRSHQLFIGESHILNLKNNTCSYVIVDPGIIAISYRAKISPFAILGTALDRSVGSKVMVDFPTDTGREYYLEFKLNTADAVRNSVDRLDLVPKIEAIQKSKKCKYGASHEFA